MDSPSDLVALVQGRAPTLGRTRLLCLDGPAGSGKTTLAAAVAALTPARVIHLDDLYDGWGGLPRLRAQLDPLLLPLAEGRPGSYRRYDWHAGAYAERVRVEPCDLLVVEGVGAGLSAYAHLRTALVWVAVPTEVRMAKILGGDLVGMSTTLETIAAREAGMEVLGISLVTNLGAGIAPQPLNHAEVIEAGKAAEPRLRALLAGLLARL